MRALTVYQPYAFAIVAGLKHYETRKHRVHIRERIALHAAKGAPKFVTMEAAVALPENATLHYGAVIGTVEIVDCVPVEEIRDSLTEREEALGDYSPGRFAWVLENPVMFEHPIPVSGHQGWWNWDECAIPTKPKETKKQKKPEKPQCDTCGNRKCREKKRAVCWTNCGRWMPKKAHPDETEEIK